MTTYISLLRGINVSGQKKIKMADLQALYESLGFNSVTTYIQSGNVIFESQQGDKAALSSSIHNGIEAQFGYVVEVFVYTVNQWRRIIEHNPFAGDGDKHTKIMHVTLLASKPDAQAVAATRDLDTGDDQFYLHEQTLYFYAPGGYGRSKFPNNFWERKLKVSATTRNWNTVNKLLALAQSLNE